MLTETILLEQNKRLRQEKDELQEEVRQLRDTLSARSENGLPIGLPKMSPSEQAVLRLLLSRKGPVTREAIYITLYGDERRSMKGIRVWIHKLRHKLEDTPFSITTETGFGYTINRGAV